MQTWILIIGGLVVLGVGLDLLRRMRSAGRDSHDMDMHMQLGVGKDDPLVAPVTPVITKGHPDFPNGGARKISREESRQERAENRPERGEKVPKVEPSIKSSSISLDDTQKIRRTPVLPATPAAVKTKEADPEMPIPLLMDTEEERAETTFSSTNDDPFMSGRHPILSKPRVVPRKPSDPEPEAGPVEVIIVNVMSREPEGLAGARLLETVLSCGLRYGEMNIFHYHLSETDDTTLFSMANILKPGTFDLNSMQSFQTPGVSFFMSLPLRGGEKVSAMETFEKMLACAKKVAQNLNGELRDERRSVMTGQTVEHCRQRISEFSRLTLSRSGKISKP